MAILRQLRRVSSLETPGPKLLVTLDPEAFSASYSETDQNQAAGMLGGTSLRDIAVPPRTFVASGAKNE
jgi:hypothetical protein